MTKQLTRQEVEAVVEKLAGNRIGSLAKFPIMPIRLGEVLEKMQGQGEEELSVGAMEFDIIELVQLWEPLGLSRSLQEIIDASGYGLSSQECRCRKTNKFGICLHSYVQVLTSPETNALFSFLQEIL